MPKLRLVPGGVNVYVDPVTGKVTETHSSTCNHCQHLSEFESLKRMFNKKDPGSRWEVVDICRGCMKLICEKCAMERMAGAPCVPFERRLEWVENLHRLKTRVHMQAWRCY